MSNEIHYEASGVYRRYFGVVMGDEIIDGNMNFYGYEKFDNVHYAIVDFLEAEEFEISEEQIAEISSLDRAAAMTNPRMKVAIVATAEKLKQLAALYIKSSEGSPWKTEMFDNLGDARQWAES